MKLKGAWLRAKQERRYYKSRNWSYEEVGKFWDTVKDYDEIDDETYAYKRRFYDSLRMSSLVDKSKTLDLDCRTGNGTVFYFQQGKVSEAVCVSPSSTFLEVCRKRTEKYGIKAQPLLLRELPLPLVSDSFENILCFETVEHVSDHLALLQELYRLSKNKGQLILTMPNILWEPVHWFAAIFSIHHSEGPHRFQSRKKIRKMLEEVGFKIIKEDTTVLIPAGPGWLTNFGEKLEIIIGKRLRNILALRHIFIAEAVKNNEK